MFLFERLFGVGVYSLVLVCVCFYLKGLTDYKKIKRTLVIYSLILAAMGFYYVPYKTSDLYRIYEYVDLFRSYSFAEMWSKEPWNAEIGIAAFYYWAIGKTGVSQLLPAINALVCYSCIFYIIHRYAKRNQIIGKNIAIALFFYMSIGNYMFVITGIRCMLGISLLAFCFFRECVEKRFNILHILLYTIAIFIHPFAAVLVVARFVVPIFNSENSLAKRAFLIFSLCVATVIGIGYFKGYIIRIFEKADSYLSGDMYSYIWEYVISVFVCLICIAVLYSCRKGSIRSDGGLNSFSLYSIVLFITSLCFCYEFTIFHRLTTYILPIILLPLLMKALQEGENRRYENGEQYNVSLLDRPINLDYCVLVLSLLLLFVTCSRGSLSSLKFFVL